MENQSWTSRIQAIVLGVAIGGFLAGQLYVATQIADAWEPDGIRVHCGVEDAHFRCETVTVKRYWPGISYRVSDDE